jgi:hypothetical protein
MIQISLKMDEMHALLHAQSMTPNPRMHQAMKRAADRAFARTQADVHVDTGSLKASGRTHDFMRGATENLEVFTAAMLEQWDA